jgi:hypothetical protein
MYAQVKFIIYTNNVHVLNQVHLPGNYSDH